MSKPNKNPRVCVGLDGKPEVWAEFADICYRLNDRPAGVLRRFILRFISRHKPIEKGQK